jgi:hypothetical protein
MSMSEDATTDHTGHLEVAESPKDSLPKLAELARQAFEQKRTKECLDLTRAILLIDPENAAALWMRSSIQSEMHRDLENARAVLRQAQSKEPAEAELEPVPEPILEVSGEESIPAETANAGFIASSRWLVRAAAVLVVAVMIVGALRLRTLWNPVDASPRPNLAATASVVPPASNVNLVEPDPLSARSPEFASVSAVPIADRTSAADRSAEPVLPRPSTKTPDPPVINAAPGTLAISSPTTVDIFRDDSYLGSAPVSLDLPAGTQTLEYRHGNLRKQVTHVIKSNETTKAMITFEITVQVNSKPWSEVFLDGVERKDLGQTPMSGVRVPIGSVLIFQNPQFPAKRYRVTGNETGIQIVFP